VSDNTFLLNTTKVKSVSVVVKDISELKQKEEDLIKQKKRVEDANKAKSGFLRHVSHELRTPMACILGRFLNFNEKNTHKRAYSSLRNSFRVSHSYKSEKHYEKRYQGY
jgi:signal transduction histidine kinase